MGGRYTQSVTGKSTVPLMDWESSHITDLSITTIGGNKGTTLHALVFNDSGINWGLDIYEQTNSGEPLSLGTTSSGTAFINSAPFGIITYDKRSDHGFFVNSKKGIPGSLTVLFRTDS